MVCAAALSPGFAVGPRVASAEPFGFGELVERAREMGARKHEPPVRVGPKFESLDYDQYRLISARFDQAVWRKENLPFWVEPHHAGFLFPYPKKIHLVDNGDAQPLPFEPGLFQYRGKAEPLAHEPGGGFAGFRLLTRFLNRPNPQEFASFLGASYFRVLGAHDWYGASARGLAIDVGLGTPEEFPRFIEFWIERPYHPDSIRVWALLDGPAVAGAYEFQIFPGEETTVSVACSLFFRHGVQKVGVAPITSMWMWEAWNKPVDDPRPEVHDSDGLLISDGDRWTWRPLATANVNRVTRFPVDNLRGFGLMQRDREYENYADNEARYHLRPGVWVEAGDGFPKGGVELLELTGNHEGYDNIGAYWVPAQAPARGDRVDLRYTLRFGQQDPHPDLAHFNHTIPKKIPAGSHYFLVLEGGGELMSATRDKAEPFIETTGCELGEVRFEKQPDNNWVLSFDLLHPHDQPAEVTAEVRIDGRAVSETWSYTWTP